MHQKSKFTSFTVFLEVVNHYISLSELFAVRDVSVSGILQGTVLGPILFIIVISDLCKDLLMSVASKYADDTKNTAKIGNLKTRYAFKRN